jgi:hypothetical protein
MLAAVVIMCYSMCLLFKVLNSDTARLVGVFDSGRGL